MKTYFTFALVIFLIVACTPQKKEDKKITTMYNSLTEAQRSEGWQLLFDGESTAGWRNFNSATIGDAWVIDDEALHLDKTKAGRGDIITDREYENFELQLEWKIDSCGNSGIIFNVVEDPKYKYIWQTGPEMQVLDNECHPDAKIIKHRAGDLYDLISCSTETVRPAGEWNQVRIISDNGAFQFWLNGTNVVNFTMHTPEWDEMVAGSKFKDMADFGKASRGHIALQDHDDKVWYRNIMIREL